ncbi:Tssc4 protein [Echinococcus multilocularis]|uniref:Tssc4 protein n=1 Tax=Echinococcus multilocularis TaxID=6211 RepID=A0A0S4MPZ1_ECHMU|nr:Tssc4 protein [Echinococcus multilocularis]
MDGNSCTDFFNYCLRKNHDQGQRNSKQGLCESNKRDNGKTNPPTARYGHLTTAIRSQFTQTAPERLIGWSSTICSGSSTINNNLDRQDQDGKGNFKTVVKFLSSC